MVTGIIDHTRDANGAVHARLLDLVQGRSGKAYADWLKEQGASSPGIKAATLDPFRGYANAIRDELREATTVVDAFHIVKLGTATVDEVRRRVQHHARPERGREFLTEILASFPSCPIPGVAQLGRSLRAWKQAILAYFDTAGASNGPPKQSTA